MANFSLVDDYHSIYSVPMRTRQNRLVFQL